MTDTLTFSILIADESRLGVEAPVLVLERNGVPLHEINLVSACAECDEPCVEAIANLILEAERDAGCPLAWLDGMQEAQGWILRSNGVDAFEAIVLSESLAPMTQE